MDITGIIDQNFIDQQVEATKGNSRANANGFDPDMFLKILMTQLQNQSPFDTMDTQQILETQSLLTQVEQVTKQTTTLKETKDTVSTGLNDLNTTLANMNATLLLIAEDLGVHVSSGNGSGQ